MNSWRLDIAHQINLLPMFEHSDVLLDILVGGAFFLSCVSATLELLADQIMALFHCMVRYGSARLGTVRYGSVRVGLHFHRSLVPL